MELKDTVAIVTGGSRGIGRGIALALAKEGTNVVVADLPSERAAMDETKKLIEAEGVQAHLVDCDVRVEAQTVALVKEAIDRFGKIDILVNNAGVISVAPVAMMSEEAWDRVIDVNLKGTFLCSKAVAPHMMERRSGRIINLSSMAGRRGNPGLAHYCTSKWGIIGFTQSLALELGALGITVNAVCPGVVDSAMWRDHLIPAIAMAQGEPSEAAWESFVRDRIALGRPQTVEDIGEAVVYLCRAENVTGEAINVTGGAELR